ncbi:MFS transporter [Actinacidiphila sp. ITFR-21]|uniref:MFS transporter n=1 Tax=Actinacidiphila sp. ITFR-21 TaxID=3075199 RepID=UPI00288BC59D|nr:MFS transporter [Streptomyces sp. ITFR-21]WNI18782.1 MFS transporter [Streptomyces sp. ITFR-21]
MPSLLPDRGPRRLLAVATLINMTGYGVYLTAGVLYFTSIVRLPAAQVGIGLSVAGAVALVTGIPAGHLADRRGARGTYAVTLLLGAAAMAGLCLAHGFWTFLVFASLGSIAQAAGPAARSPLVREYGGERPAEYRAYLRSVTNIGISVGALLAGWGVQVDSKSAYLLLIAGSAVASAACAGVVLLMPPVEPGPAGTGPRWIALRDRPYLLLTVLDGVMAVQYRVLTAAVPLWLIGETSAPRWSVSGVMLVNTAIVVLFQVRASRSIDTPRAGGVAFRRAGLAFLISCALISLLPGAPTWLVMALLLAAVAVHTVGEIWQAAGGFEVSFALAPAHAVGQYQGLFGMGLGLGTTIGPVLLISLCIDWGRPGWWVVGALFAVTGLAVPATVRWAERARPLPADRTDPAEALA